MEDLHKIAQDTNALKRAMSGLGGILLLLSKMPIVGGVASTAKATLRPMKFMVEAIQSKVKRIDQRLYPSLKNKLETLRAMAEQVEYAFNQASSKCNVGNRNHI